MTEADPMLELSRRQSMTWRTFVVPEFRVMFVQVNKNACTSLKWMMAGIAGEDLDAFGPGVEASTNRFDDIHDRRQWHRIPRLDDLDPQVRRSIHPDNGWFVFAVVRDPRSRIFSAWESKLLLDNPGYRRRQSVWWFPRHPATAETVVEDFAAFSRYVERNPTIDIAQDGHFRGQVEMLHEDLVTYSEIYDIRDLGRLKTDLRAHLEREGWSGELYLPRVNDTPLRANAAVFAGDGGEVRERIEKLYAADFERFAGWWDFAAIEAVPDWTDDQLREVDQIAEHGRRIGMLLDEIMSLRAEVSAEREIARSLNERVDKLKHRVRAAETPKPWKAHLRADARRAFAGVRRRIRSG